jgi:putative transcriptional regulator
MSEKELDRARVEIAGLLKQRRSEMGLSQQQLADKIGVARETINRMEAGKFWLVMKQFVLVCSALELDYRKVFN